MNIRWKRTLLAMLLAAAMLLAMPVGIAAEEDPASGSAAADNSLDLTRKVTLTIEPSGSVDIKNDLSANAVFVYDVYKIADAELDQTADGITYSSFHFVIDENGPFGSLKSEMPLGYDDLPKIDPETGSVQGDATLWRQYAQKAGEYAVNNLSSVSGALKTVTPGSTVELDAGLYLVLARSNNDPSDPAVLPDKTDYAKWDESSSPKTLVGTQVRSTEYLYTFQPELVALPFPEANIPSGDGADPVSTAGGHWEYSVTAVLKPGRELRYDSLKVVKNLEIYNDTTNTAQIEPVSFVFRVEVEKTRTETDTGGNTSEVKEFEFEDIIMFTFTAPGEKSCLYEDMFPVGASVTVTEVYTGAGYVNNSPVVVNTFDLPGNDLNGKPLEILPPESADAPATATFKDECKNELIHGYGVLNQYSYENGNWTTVNTGDSNGTVTRSTNGNG